MTLSKEIDRVEGFTDGDYTCVCGEELTLYWNGGKLDEVQCKCGKHYHTEYYRVDLVICNKQQATSQ